MDNFIIHWIIFILYYMTEKNEIFLSTVPLKSSPSFLPPFFFFSLSNWSCMQMASPLEHASNIQQEKLLHSSTLSSQLESHNTRAKFGYVKDHFEKQLPRLRYSEPKARALCHHHRGQVLAHDSRSCIWCSTTDAKGQASSPPGVHQPCRAPPWREHSLRTQPSSPSALGVTSSTHIY